MQIAQIQLRIHYCTPCSDAISGPKNRVCEIKSGHDFCRYRNSIQVIYFQINATCSVLLTTLNNVGSKTLFNAVFIRPEQVVRFLLCRSAIVFVSANADILLSCACC